MPIDNQLLRATTDTVTLLFFDKNGKQHGDLNIDYYPFTFNYTEYTAMRQTLNESQLRQLRIDQLNMSLREPVADELNAEANLTVNQTSIEPIEMVGNVIQMAPVKKRGITHTQFEAFTTELQALLRTQTDATQFINGFMQKVVQGMDLLNNGQPYDWTNDTIKKEQIENLGFAIINLAASQILERCSGGKAQGGVSPLARLVSVK